VRSRTATLPQSTKDWSRALARALRTTRGLVSGHFPETARYRPTVAWIFMRAMSRFSSPCSSGGTSPSRFILAYLRSVNGLAAYSLDDTWTSGTPWRRAAPTIFHPNRMSTREPTFMASWGRSFELAHDGSKGDGGMRSRKRAVVAAVPPHVYGRLDNTGMYTFALSKMKRLAEATGHQEISFRIVFNRRLAYPSRLTWRSRW
jgi:hypothetical protein